MGGTIISHANPTLKVLNGTFPFPNTKLLTQKKVQMNGRQRSGRQVTIPRMVNGFPPEMQVKMKYVDSYAITMSAGVGIVYQYRLNSIFDPDLTSTGHQPYTRDTWAAVYGSYCVQNCRYKVTMASSVPTVFSCRAVNASNAPASYTLEQERPYSKGGFATLQQPAICSDSVDIAKIMAIPKSQLLNLDNQTTQTANPTTGVYLNIYAFGPDPTATPVCYFNVELEYDVRLTQLIENLSQS